jgi:hypothetical protein
MDVPVGRAPLGHAQDDQETFDRGPPVVLAFARGCGRRHAPGRRARVSSNSEVIIGSKEVGCGAHLVGNASLLGTVVVRAKSSRSEVRTGNGETLAPSWKAGASVPVPVSQTAAAEVVLAGEAELPFALVGYATDYDNGVHEEPTPVERLR